MIEIRDEYTGLAKDWYTVAEVAKILDLKDAEGRPIGRNKMFILLREEKILMEDNNYPYQYYLNLDLVMMHRVQKTRHVAHVPLFSQRGINYLKNRFKIINN